jgi:hypothetical protein
MKTDSITTDLTRYVWKSEKILNTDGSFYQETTRLIDMNMETLQKCYNHCKVMLYNEDPKNPGRYTLLSLIADQQQRCGIELCLRFLDQEYSLSRFSLIQSINDFLQNNKEALVGVKPTLSLLFSNLPDEYKKLSIPLLMDGCLDRLGVINKKAITRTFILKQGVWLTRAESKELLDPIQENFDRLTIVKENLNLKETEELRLNSMGLSYSQMRAMLNLKPNKKYSELTTLQLETLRNRILFELEKSVTGHIDSWEERMEEIELVANEKMFKLS